MILLIYYYTQILLYILYSNTTNILGSNDTFMVQRLSQTITWVMILCVEILLTLNTCCPKRRTGFSHVFSTFMVRKTYQAITRLAHETIHRNADILVPTPKILKVQIEIRWDLVSIFYIHGSAASSIINTLLKLLKLLMERLV